MVTERRIFQKNNENMPRHLTDTGIVEELTNLVFAGTDTTSNTLAYLFWELSHQPEWQVRVREEIQQAIGLERETFSYTEISELPVLDAVISEILRLRPAGPAGLPRLAPEGGAVIDGVAIPAYVCYQLSTLLIAADFSHFVLVFFAGNDADILADYYIVPSVDLTTGAHNFPRT